MQTTPKITVIRNGLSAMKDDVLDDPVKNTNPGRIKTKDHEVPGLFSANFLKNYFTHGTSVERINGSPVHRAVLEHAQTYRCSQSRLVFLLIIPMCVIYLFTLGDNLKNPAGMYWWVCLVFAGTTLRLIYCENLKNRIETSSAEQLIKNEHGLLISALIPSIFVGAGNWWIGSGGDEYAVLSAALSSVIYAVGHASSVSVYPFALHILLLSNLGQTIAFHFGLGEGNVNPEIGALLCAMVFVLMTMSRKLYSFFRQSKKSEYLSLIASAEGQKTIEMKDAFIRSASHDLSQPATALSVLAGSLKFAEKDSERADIAESMAKVAVILAEEVGKLDVGTGADSSERSGSVNIKDLCEAVAAAGGVQAGDIEIIVEVDDPEAYVSNEYWVVARCVSNALNNALLHSGTDRVVIRVESTETSDMDKEIIAVTVEDFGTGMESSLFNSVWNQNSGDNYERLGIASIQQLTENNGIEVTLESASGKGTKLTMYLDKTDPTTALHSSAATILRGSKVLIVDDQIIVAEAIQRLLENIECETVVFTDPLKAMIYTEYNSIDFVFIDDNLNADIDGLSLGKLISVPNHRIAIITGNAMKERREYIASHFNVIRKPVDLEKMENAFI